jgi:hypothetical protein
MKPRILQCYVRCKMTKIVGISGMLQYIAFDIR